MRIALFLPNWVGDVVMATPAIRAVRERHPDARILALGRSYVAGVLQGSPWIEQVVSFEKKGPRKDRLLGVAATLRRERVDLALLFPNSWRSAAAAWLGRCRQRIGFARYGRSPLLTTRLKPVVDRRGRIVPSPILPDYNRLAEAAGCPVRSNHMELFTTSADEAAADQVWNQLGLGRFSEVIVLNPGAAYGAAKLWPAASFATLARKLAEDRGAGILILCGPAERALAAQIASEASHPAVVSLADAPLSLGLTKACIRRCDLLISTDSGPRHFAAAFRRPVVALFGPTFIAWTETFYEQEIRLQKSVPCGPCQQRTCHLDHRCMRELTSMEVYSAATRLLDGAPPRRSLELRHAS